VSAKFGPVCHIHINLYVTSDSTHNFLNPARYTLLLITEYIAQIYGYRSDADFLDRRPFVITV